MLTQPHIIFRRIHALYTVASLKLIALVTRGERSAGIHRTFLSKDPFSKFRKCEQKLTKYIEKKQIRGNGAIEKYVANEEKRKNSRRFYLSKLYYLG